MASSSDAPAASARYRYAAVFALTLTLLVFVIVAPNADWSRAVALSIESAALIVAIATSRGDREVRRIRTAVVAVLGVLAVIGVGVGVLGPTATTVLSGVLALAIPLSLVRGLLRLVTVHGVTLQAVAGALAIYLLIGLLFAWVIGFIVQVDASAVLRERDRRHRGRTRVLQPVRPHHDGVRGLHGRTAGRAGAGGAGDARRPALPCDRDRAHDRQLRRAPHGVTTSPLSRLAPVPQAPSSSSKA